jgi:hypothetical protein
MLAFALWGCQTADDIRQGPRGFSLVVSATWDKAGTCIASSQLGSTYLPVPSERRAEVMVIASGLFGPQEVAWMYQIEESGSGSKITWLPGGSAFAPLAERRLRQMVERCGKA